MQRVFDLVERGLKLREILRGAKLRIGFREREELAQGAGQHALGLPFGRGALRGHGLIARGGDGLEGAAFVRGISLDRFDQVGDQVVAALELNVNIRPGVVTLHAQPNESVVENHDQ